MILEYVWRVTLCEIEVVIAALFVDELLDVFGA